LILLIVQGYMEFLISSVLVILAPEESIDKQGFMLNAAYIFLAISVVVLPLLYIWIISLKTAEL
jgi:hypothetical protein